MRCATDRYLVDLEVGRTDEVRAVRVVALVLLDHAEEVDEAVGHDAAQVTVHRVTLGATCVRVCVEVQEENTNETGCGAQEQAATQEGTRASSTSIVKVFPEPV